MKTKKAVAILIASILGALMPQMIPQAKATGTLLYSTNFDFLNTSKDYTNPYLTGSGRISDWIYGLHYIQTDGDPAFIKVWTDSDGTPPVREGGGTKLLGQQSKGRNEVNIKPQYLTSGTQKVYATTWLYLNSTWELLGSDYWYEIANPCQSDAPQGTPKAKIHFKKTIATGLYRIVMMHQYSGGNDQLPGGILDIPLVDMPRGRWFQLRYYADRITGTVKAWIYDQGTLTMFCNTTGINLGYVSAPNNWYTSVSKIYYGGNVQSTDKIYKIWCSGFEIWDDMPSEEEDVTAPTISNVAHNTTVAAMPVEFSCKWTDDVGLSGSIFSYKEGAGVWSNASWTELIGAAAWRYEEVASLPVAGTTVYYKWFCNDTSDNWASSATYSLLTTTVGSNVVVLLNYPSDQSTSHAKEVTFVFLPVFQQTVVNASLWLNLTGTWQSVAWNSSAITNNTANSIAYTFTASTMEPFIWNIGVYNATHAIFAANNRTLTVEVKPYYSDQGYSTNVCSEACDFSIMWYDGDGLSGYVFSHNIGGWQNSTWTTLNEAVGAEISETETLPDTNVSVSFRFYVNDTDNNWVASTISTFLTVMPPTSSSAAADAANALQQFVIFLSEGDWLGFLQAIYVTSFMSVDLFYGFIILLFMAPIYIRTRSLILVCILWILIGSGLIVAAPMVAALGIAFMALGIAGVLVKVFTSLR